jgi:5-methyltetrahydrofolate--homocysteine methyltransferase
MSSRFAQQVEQRVLVFDGAMGTSIHPLPLDLETDYLGRENCTEVLVLTRPEVIQGIHESFLAAGADVIETDTFGANKLVFAEFDLVERTREINRRAAEVARAAADRHSTSDRPRFVAGSMGPGTKLLTLGHTTWRDMLDSYFEQARGLIEGGADILVVETCQDILQAKCALTAALRAIDGCGKTPDEIPLLASLTIETSGTMLLGTEIAAAAEILKGFPIFSLGLNCATGPLEMTEHVKWLSRHWARPISVIPNAGIPALVDGKADFPLQPEEFARTLVRFVEQFGVSMVGGCCGTRPEHIARLKALLGDRAPVRIDKAPAPAGCASLYAPVAFRQDTSFLIVGERTNTNGSRKFKRLLAEEDWDGLVAMGREQARDGSHVIDVSVDCVGRNGARDMREVIRRFASAVPLPLMLDSTQIDVLEAGLELAPGKCILNSTNLEDGEERFARICALARLHGAAVVLGTIDEDPGEAMAKTADRKLAIAERMYDLAVRTHGLRPEDIFFDALVLPITTGVEADRRLALETVEGVRRIAERLPDCQTVLGISNVSFGLKQSARVVLNSVFLHECVAAGLTSAIVHASKILPRNRIDPTRWNAALDLIYDRRRDAFDPLTTFIQIFADEDEPDEGARRAHLADLPLEERLRRHIVDGEREGLTDSLDEALRKYEPLAIVNDHLLDGMKEVGRLFASGEMQLPFVLQSAEVMKAAVGYLEPHMPKVGGAARGKMVLATVKGDVHDIGKNLVDIILTNNGYSVVNLGIKQPISAILEAYRVHRADAIGLSGLLVKSVAVMQENLEEMRTLGLEVPVILGGAALTRAYAEETLRGVYPHTHYGNDAFEGLRFMDHVSSGRIAVLDEEVAGRAERSSEKPRRVRQEATVGIVGSGVELGATALADGPDGLLARTRSDVARGVIVPHPPFWGDRVVERVDLDEIYPYINKIALFRGQWQFRKRGLSQEKLDEVLREEVEPIFARLQAQCREERILEPSVAYGWFPVQADGDALVVLDPHDHDRELERFVFPRQKSERRLCISDFFRSKESGEIDVLGLTCVTVGPEVSRRAKQLFEADAYSEYLYLHGFGVECAEALAEMWHKRMRMELGISGEDSPRIRELFQQRYRGSRYSFGYPACPDLAEQAKIWRLLRPERIGCTLTDTWQIEPEQSTSALIVHHPEAKYFTA